VTCRLSNDILAVTGYGYCHARSQDFRILTPPLGFWQLSGSVERVWAGHGSVTTPSGRFSCGDGRSARRAINYGIEYCLAQNHDLGHLRGGR